MENSNSGTEKQMDVWREEALEHDFQREAWEECRCGACGALNPVGCQRCLACGERLSGEDDFTTQREMRQPLGRLVGLDREGREAFFELADGTYQIGRDSQWKEYLRNFECVSRRHLVLTVEAGQVRCRALPTTNGTFYGKEGEDIMVRLPVEVEFTLHPGDRLGLGGDNTGDPGIAFVRYVQG